MLMWCDNKPDGQAQNDINFHWKHRGREQHSPMKDLGQIS